MEDHTKKKILSVLHVLAMLLSASTASAENMGVQVISGLAAATESVSLVNFMLNAEVEIEGYRLMNATEFAFMDRLEYYRLRNNFISYGNEFCHSGHEANHALLKMDIINTAPKPHDYLAACEANVLSLKATTTVWSSRCSSLPGRTTFG